MPATTHTTVVAVSSWPLEKRIEETLKRSEKKMPAELWNQVKELLSPASLAIMATVTAAWAISQFFGVGEMADAVLLVGGAIAFGGSAAQIGREGLAFALGVKNAKNESDLDGAAQHFANFVIWAGVTAVLALFFKMRPKVLKVPFSNDPIEIPKAGFILSEPIAAVLKPTPCVGSRNAGKSVRDSLLQRFPGARLGNSQECFDFRPALLDRVEIG